MMNNKQGQILVQLVVFFLTFTIFIFAAPIVSEIIDGVVGNMGSATAFVVRSFLWLILITFIAVFFRIIGSGGGFFTG